MNKHIHHTLADAHNPFFTASIKTPTGERGCRFQAGDSHSATLEGLRRLNVRDDEIDPSGIVLNVKVTS